MAAAVAAALALPFAARAHTEFNFTAAQATAGVPTIDGTMSTGEWAAASTFVFPTGVDGGQFWAMRDATTLYVAFRTVDLTGGGVSKVFELFFDNAHNGTLGQGDDLLLVNNTSNVGIDDYFDAELARFVGDTAGGGTADVTGASTFNAGTGEVIFEASRPLCGPDVLDACIRTDADVGFTVVYQNALGTVTGYPTSNGGAQGAFGHFRAATFVDVNPPSVTLTAPAAGAWVRGSFVAKATASDALGVSRVEFELSHPSIDPVTIVDTEAPYEASLEVPAGIADGSVLTLKATAYDTSENTAAVTRTVKLDRTPPTGTVLEPADGEVVSGTVEVVTEAEDATSGVASVVTFFSPPEGLGHAALSFSPPYVALWNTVSAGEGTGRITVRITDRAGNFTEFETLNVTIENGLPAQESMTVEQPADFASIDPARASTTDEYRLADLTCAYLYRAPGDGGGPPEADAAAGPMSFDAERNEYTIPVRGDLRFSDGDPVTPQSFVRAIERTLLLDGFQARFFLDIVGAGEFRIGYSDSVEGLTATEDALQIRLVRRNDDLAARLGLPGACPVPEGAAPATELVEPFPASGSFYLASRAAGRQAVLRLNEEYGGDRPQGLRRIVLQFGRPLAEVADAIEGNEVDFGRIPPARVAALRDAYSGSRFFEPHAPVLWYLSLATQRYPTSSVLVRNAINMVLDRAELAGLATSATPTDQLLPRTVPGFADASIFPQPNAATVAEAARMVEEADAAGATIRLYARTSGFSPAVAAAIESRLELIGLNVEVLTFPTAELFDRLRDPEQNVHLGLVGWGADYLDPWAVLHPLVHSQGIADGTNLSRFSHEGVDADIEGLLSSPGQERYALAAQLDEAIMREHAPIAPLFETRTPVFVSSRLGCLRFPALFGLNLASACQRAEDEGLAFDYGPAEPEVESAYSRVRYADLPAGQLRFGSSDEAIADTPLDAVPLDAVTLANSPLDAVPLDAVTIDPGVLEEIFGGLPLTGIPIDYPGGWAAVLANTALGNVPLQTVTLADVLRLDPKPAPLAPPPGSNVQALPLDAVDLSGTPLDAVPLSALLLGSLPLDAVPLDAVGGWCAAINTVPGFSCPNPIDPATTSLFALALRGFPLDAVPLDAVRADDIDLSQTALAFVPLDAVDLKGSPLDAVPLDAVDWAVSPLADVPLDAVLVPNVGSALRAVPLDAVPADVKTCGLPGAVTCPATLGEAFDAGLLAADITLVDILPALAGLTLGELGAYGDVTLAGVLKGLPPDVVVTIHDLLALLLTDELSRDWDALDLDSVDLGRFAFDQSSSVWRATFRANGGPLRSTMLVRAAIPAGFTFIGAKLVVGEDAVELGEPEVAAGTLHWKVRTHANTSYAIEATFLPSFDPLAAGSTAMLLQLDTGQPAVSDGPEVTQVVERYEPENDHPDTAPVLEEDSFYLTHGGEGDVDYFRIPVPETPGAKVHVSLSHATFDADLAAFGEPVAPLKPDATTRAEPLATDAPIELPLAGSIPPETLNDVPLDAVPLDAVAVRSVSSNRGTIDEELVLISQGEGGFFTVQVTGFSGSGSFMLRFEVDEAPALAPCALGPFIGSGTPGSLPASLPAGVNTLFVLNQERLGREFGEAVAANVVASLQGLAARADLGVTGALIPVEGDPQVAAAYGALDAAPCSPRAANEVFREIARVVDGLRAAHPTIEHVVLVGTDRQIPHARLLDESVFAPETDYAARFAGTGSPLEWAFGLGYLLSDDPYGDAQPAEFLGHQLFVPDVGLGRLVETPDEIVGHVTRFGNANGVASLATELTTGYDFLTDGAQATANALTGASGPDTELISETWSRDDWLARAFPAGGGGPAMNALNAHFDHQRALPALENALSRETELLTTQHIADRGPDAVLGRLFVSVGCHSALNVPNGTVPAELAVDWVDTLMGQSAFGYAGNTGFGLGDTLVVGYSERLQQLFAERLNGTMTVGQALAFAKQAYIGELAVLTGYDEKVSLEQTYYGLPMLRVGSAAPPTPPAPLPTSTDTATGLTVASTTLAPSFQLRSDAARGSWYEADGVAASDRRPLQPVVRLDVTQPGLTAHGVALTSLVSSDEADFDAAFSRVIVDSSDERELVGEGIYPSRLQALRTIATPQGRRQQAVLFAGQFRSDGTPDARGVGIQRRYTSIGVKVYYSASADFRPASIRSIDLALVGPTLSFAVEAVDRDEHGAEVEAAAVDVLYQDESGVWRRAALTRTEGTHRWTGGGPAAGENVVYFVQVVDQAGNVALSSFKGQLVPIVAEPPTGGIGFSIDGPTAENGWFRDAVSVAVTGSPDVTYELSVDGSPFATFDQPVVVSGTGLHELRGRGSDGSRATAFVGIDATPPAIALDAPPDGAILPFGSTPPVVTFDCTDSGSGVASCQGSQASGSTLDTSKPGPLTLTVTARDGAGNETEVRRTYEVRYDFKGFFSPVANLPAMNVVKAGSTVPVKFSLGGDRGLGILATGYPRSVPISCASPGDATPIEGTSSVGQGLRYDAAADQYHYNWKTQSAWAGTCRQLVVALVDGSFHRANFRFK